jgi:hypothetical protein
MRPPLPSGSFCGKTLKTYRVGVFVLDESSYPPGIEIPKHAHEHPVGYLVLGGSCADTYGSRTRTMAATDTSAVKGRFRQRGPRVVVCVFGL